jgi:dephospho-CoA kinase
MIVLGLTGSIGMGKSTAAKMFTDLGVPVSEADAVVHALYEGEAVDPIAKVFPGTKVAGVVDRTELSRQLAENPARFKKLEAIVHPLVREKERLFVEAYRAAGARLVVLDIPLLFETGGEKRVDAVAVVSCDPDIQRERVLKRPGMTPEKFALMLSRQVPDREKRARADYVIDTGGEFDITRAQVTAVVDDLLNRQGS